MRSLLTIVTLVGLTSASPLENHQQGKALPDPRYEQETFSPVPYDQQPTVSPSPRSQHDSGNLETDRSSELRPDYFDTVGIPLAKEIYEIERAIMERIKRNQLDKRIIGGKTNPVGTTKFLGGVHVKLTTGERGVCGCNLLAETWAVTAAHCWNTSRYQAELFDIRYGSGFFYYDGVQVTTKDVTMHEQYKSGTLENDIAIIKQPKVGLTALIGIVKLPTAALANETFVDKWCKSAGFGRNATDKSGDITYHQPQRIVDLQVITNKACKRQLNPIFDTSICTRDGPTQSPVGTCKGDSGGPLYYTEGLDEILTGIVSWGDTKCEIKAAVFTRVTSFVNWINNKMKN